MAKNKKIKDIILKLHPLERKVVPYLRDNVTEKDLAGLSKLSEVEITRALQWLENKDVLKIHSDEKEFIQLSSNGEKYIKDGLPEIRYLEVLSKSKEGMAINDIVATKKLDFQEAGSSTGILKGKAAIDMKDGKVSITDSGKKILKSEPLEMSFLKKIERTPILFSDISDEGKYAFENLIKRKDIIKKVTEKTKTITLTDFGKELSKEKISNKKVIDLLTPNMLKDGSWKGKDFRAYDIEINVPKIHGGKRQPYSEFVEKVRKKVVELGFVEHNGPIIETEFFNFDALYQPQNHPARLGTDIYRIKAPKQGKLPDEKLVDAVKKAHEKGIEGSSGWQYKWHKHMASKLLARAHDTAISPRIMMHGVKSPGRYFSLVRCYRPDVIDATHGVEFNQLGGFVIGKDLNFRHLLGLLKEFVIDMTGYTNIKFLPDYFPFTEPSVQISVKREDGKWIELAGAGVFRPELTEPLGIKEPVIAWGFGIDRLAMLKLGVKDIRNLFSHDIEYLRKSKKVQL